MRSVTSSVVALRAITLACGLAAAALAVGTAATASAQEGGDQTVYKKKTIIDFSDVTITGELTKPEGQYMSARKGSQFNKLIKVRENFIPEMMQSVDKL